MVQLEERTLRDLSASNIDQQLLCITYPAMTSVELNSGLILLLLSFSRRAGEDSHKHLKKFHIVCDGMRPHGVIEE